MVLFKGRQKLTPSNFVFFGKTFYIGRFGRRHLSSCPVRSFLRCRCIMCGAFYGNHGAYVQEYKAGLQAWQSGLDLRGNKTETRRPIEKVTKPYN
jgi:hypothetical protein